MLPYRHDATTIEAAGLTKKVEAAVAKRKHRVKAAASQLSDLGISAGELAQWVETRLRVQAAPAPKKAGPPPGGTTKQPKPGAAAQIRLFRSASE